METTYELIAHTKSLFAKEQLIEKLNKIKISTYVESSFNLDEKSPIEEAYNHPILSEEITQGPLTIYSYDLEHLQHLTHLLKTEFKEQITLKINNINTNSWKEGWKKYFQPITTDLFYIYPPWEKRSTSSKINICIEPGMAFGTGQHATTKLCLKLLEEVSKKTKDLSNKSTLDLGTGSGILAIAAAKLNAKKILAIDIDKDSITATKNNATKNNVIIQSIYTSCENFLISKNSVYDIIFANILNDTLLEIIPPLKKQCRSGTLVIMSGILSEQSPQIIEKAKKNGFVLLKILQEDDWNALLFSFEGG